MNNKGFFFTTIAIALSLVILVSYNVYNAERLKDRMGAIETRVGTMNNFIKDLENDIGNAIFIVGFRSFLSLEDYLMENNAALGLPRNFLDDLGPGLDSNFDEVFRLGTINSQKMPLMVNNTFSNWTVKMKDQANKTGIGLDITIKSVTISQSDPWLVDVSVKLDIDVEDSKNTASWDINDKVYTKQINISSELTGNHRFIDPLYLVNTDGIANNTIRQTPYSNWPADLSNHLTNAYYREHSDAPSYLDRFENDLTGSTYGIESLVTQRLKDEGLSVSSKSAVDYIYFGTSNPPSCNVVDIADTDFRLDDPDHTTFYSTSCI